MSRETKYMLTRRGVLKGAAALASIAVINVSMMDDSRAAKISKESVMYQETPKDDQQCDSCVLYIPGEGSSGMCQVVEGDVSASGWCVSYAPKS